MSMLPTISRAAVFHAAGQPLVLETFPVPQPQGSEAIVRVCCATVCGSDLHSFSGRRHAPTPSVLGHEMVAEIVATGPAGVNDFRGRPLALGDRVTWSMVWSCGECFYCQHGIRPKCERLLKFGHEKIIPGRALIGGLAEYCHLPEGTAIFKVPANVPDAVASPANCATVDRGSRASPRRLLPGAIGRRAWGGDARTDRLRDGRLRRRRASHRRGTRAGGGETWP